ncbi:MAG: AraC family ligand binding domain-containing protein, partial [Alphaproteobacteria bacterium]|nr:AraC family ligand binding domain-containing protein [Alphaproteobacteria bacterium]
MSQIGHRDDIAPLVAFEQAPRPLVGYARDYRAGHDTGWHKHPRAQLLHATAGTMRIATATALFIVPPGTGLWLPAHTEHITRMPAGLAMRGLFLRADAARAGPDAVTVVAISPLLRELILAACEQPVMWDEQGPVRHVVALALHEIGRAATRPISLPACRDPRLRRVTEALLADPADPRGLEAFAEI